MFDVDSLEGLFFIVSCLFKSVCSSGILDNVFNFDILVFFIFGIELNEILVYKINFFYLNDIKFNDDI